MAESVLHFTKCLTLHLIWLHRLSWSHHEILQAAQVQSVGDNCPASWRTGLEELQNSGTGYTCDAGAVLWKLVMFQKGDLFFIKPAVAELETFLQSIHLIPYNQIHMCS